MCVWLQWREVARELEGVVRIGAVNCGDDWQLCRFQGIRSYPSLLMYPQVRHTKQTFVSLTTIHHLSVWSIGCPGGLCVFLE